MPERGKVGRAAGLRAVRARLTVLHVGPRTVLLVARTLTNVLRVASLKTRSTTQPGMGYIFCILSDTPTSLDSHSCGNHTKCGRAGLSEQEPTYEKLKHIFLKQIELIRATRQTAV